MVVRLRATEAVRGRLPPAEDAAEGGDRPLRVGVLLVLTTELGGEGSDIGEGPQKAVGLDGFGVEGDAGEVAVLGAHRTTAVVEHPEIALGPGDRDGVPV